MIVEKVGKSVVYKAQDWKEHFQIFVSNNLMRAKREGDQLPRFYLPIWSPIDRDAIECWIFPLAPFVLAWRIISQIAWIIWRDLVSLLRVLYEWSGKYKKV